jgi:tetratricopeptide (TPR) repeat protein
MQLDEARVPPSGMVKKCPSCGQNLTVMPPSGGIGQELDLEGFSPAPLDLDLGGSAPKKPPSGVGRGPALAAFDSGDALELEGHPDIIDLPAPKGPAGGKSAVADAFEPDVPDLLAPVGPSSQKSNVPDLLAPVGPRPTRGGGAEIPDLLAPVGPTSRANANIPDLLAPVGPTSRSSNVPDLLAPVGPRPTRGGNIPDLLAPVGPTSTKNVPDLLAPVGPTSTRNAPDLLEPVGPKPTKNVPDLLAPVGPKPTKGGVDLPAPKGFFDDLPQPKSGGAPDLSLDSLDLVPMGPPGAPAPAAPGKAQAAPSGSFGGPPPTSGMIPSLDLGDIGGPIGPKPTTGAVPSLDLGPATPPTASGGLSLDSLDLVPGGDGGKSGPRGATAGASLDLDMGPGASGQAPPGVISFGKPSGTIPLVSTTGVQSTVRAGGAAPAKSGGAGMLDLAEPVATVKKSAGTMATDLGEATDEAAPRRPKAGTKAAAKPGMSRRTQVIAAAVLGVVVLGGGAAFYVKTRMDAAEALALRVKNGISDARRLLTSDETEHWQKAYDKAHGVLADDARNADALGLAAQAQLAWAIDTGQNADAHEKTGGEILNDAVKVSADGPELEKARALAQILADKAPAAEKTLAAIAHKDARDVNAALYLGWAALAAHDYAAAKDAFAAAVKQQSKRVPALYGLGQAQLALGDTAGARDSFDKVLGVREKHVGAWIGNASLLPRDRVGTREKRFMEIVSSDETQKAHPKDVSRAWVLAGQEALEAHRWDDANFRFKKGEDFDKDNVDAIAGRGTALLEQGNVVEARKLLEDANRRDPRDIEALIGLTRLALAEGKWDIAKDFMKQALEANQESPLVQFWNGQVMEKAPGPAGIDGAIAAYKKAAELDPTRYEPVVALSLLYLKVGKNDEALATLSTIQKEAEGDAYLANTLGHAYLSAGNIEKAEAWFRGAIAVEPKNVDAHANLGEALERKGDLPGAIAELELAYKIEPTRESVTIQLAQAYERARRQGDAEKLYLGLLDDKNGRVPTIAGRAAAGRFYAHQGDAAKAGALGDAILAEDPNHAAGLFLRGIGELASNKLADAQKDFAAAVNIDPQAQYFEALGRSVEAQNQYDEAIRYYGDAIEHDPQYADPLIDRARVHQTRREWNVSLGDLEAARKIDDRRADIFLMKGLAMYTLGDAKGSVGAFQQAIERDAKDAEAFYRLGKAYYDLNNVGAAISNLNRAIDLAKPDIGWYPEAYRTLGYAYKAAHSKGEMCQTFRKFLEIAPTTISTGDAKQELLGCP